MSSETDSRLLAYCVLWNWHKLVCCSTAWCNKASSLWGGIIREVGRKTEMWKTTLLKVNEDSEKILWNFVRSNSYHDNKRTSSTSYAWRTTPECSTSYDWRVMIDDRWVQREFSNIHPGQKFYQDLQINSSSTNLVTSRVIEPWKPGPCRTIWRFYANLHHFDT